MLTKKVKSFTLAELLVVMVITAIVVGLAFSVLRLVQNQINKIQNNYHKATQVGLFEQMIWQDFNSYNSIRYIKSSKTLMFSTPIDSVKYSFYDDFILRNRDTIKVVLQVDKLYFENKEVQENVIDAISLVAKEDLPKRKIFIFKKSDLMNQMK